jgi:hypothetical protein
MDKFTIKFNFKKKYIDWKYKKEGNPLQILLEVFPFDKCDW